MKTKELLTQLTKLENGLDQFSYKELGADEAAELKKSFINFKNGLQSKVFGDDPNSGSVEKPSLKPADIQLMANVTHDLRTPLNGIIGCVALLQETPLNTAQQKIASALNTASKNLMGIVNELLDFSTIALGRESFVNIPFDLKSIVADLTFLSQTLVLGKELKIRTSIADDVPTQLLGDPSKLSQILMNLMGNALKFSERGSVHLKVQALEKNNGQALLSFLVSDTGMGIPSSALETIFDSYTQATPNVYSKYGGKGLGLSIVKQLVEKMGGTIRVASILGKGSTFTFTLPYEYEEAIKQKVMPKPLLDRVRDLDGVRILVVDDNELNLKLFRHQLKSKNANTVVAKSGFQALNLLENQYFDIILLDMQLPDMSGLEFADQISCHGCASSKRTPILAVSAATSFNDPTVLNGVGINGFVAKPYALEDLVNAIHHQLHNHTKQLPTTTHHTPGYNRPQVGSNNLVNLEPLFNECRSSMGLMDELVGLFRVNMLEFIGKTKILLQENDVQGIEFSAHKILASLRMLQIDGLERIAQNIMSTCRTTKDIDQLQKLYIHFIELYPKVEAEIEQKMYALKK